MKSLTKFNQLSKRRKVFLISSAIVVVFLLLVGGVALSDWWSHRMIDDRANWQEVQEAVAWVSLSRKYQPAEQFIRTTSSFPLPKFEDLHDERLHLRIDAQKCIAVDLMRTLTRQQVAYMNRNRQIPYAKLTPAQRQMLLTLGRYQMDEFDPDRARRSSIFVSVTRFGNEMSMTEFVWSLPTKSGDSYWYNSFDLVRCSPGNILQDD